MASFPHPYLLLLRRASVATVPADAASGGSLCMCGLQLKTARRTASSPGAATSFTTLWQQLPLPAPQAESPHARCALRLFFLFPHVKHANLDA